LTGQGAQERPGPLELVTETGKAHPPPATLPVADYAGEDAYSSC